jgi:hypothetical protein
VRHSNGCIIVALALALTATSAPVAWADPLPLAQAAATIAAENCGLPLSAAWADPPPLAQTEATIWEENCSLPLSRAYAGRGFEVIDSGRPRFARHLPHDRAHHHPQRI